MPWFEATFGTDQAGKTVYYRTYDNTGATVNARTNFNVQEIGNGAYGVNIPTLNSNVVGIEWDIDSTIYAHESIIDTVDVQNIYKSIFNKRTWDKNTNVITLFENDKQTVLKTFITNADMSDIDPQQ